MKIVFLDIDGVVCLYPEWQIDWVGNRNQILSGSCCKLLKELLDTTDSKIVLTSSWRLFPKYLEDLQRQMETHKIAAGYIAGATEDFSADKAIKSHNELRWKEIKDYIEKNHVTSYVILDDFNLEKYDKEHLVRTNRYIGLTAALRDVAVRKLNK